MRSMTVSLLLLLGACSEYELGWTADDLGIPLDCELDTIYEDEVEPVESCPQEAGGFVPIVEWGAGDGQSSRAVPAVADLDGDGLPEVIANFTSGLLVGGKGDLVVLNGDGTLKWRVVAGLGYTAGLTIADLDADGVPEILGVRALGSQMPLQEGTYSVVCYDNVGTELWVSEVYTRHDFDYATSLVVSDMDHDGFPEIVAGRVILNHDGTLKGIGEHGRGSWGQMPSPFGSPVSEATVPAVADLDLDGVEEVITGDAWYWPDGATKWHDPAQADGMIALANLDDDPEGEVIVSSFDTVRAVDHDGTVMWGPVPIQNANIVSPAAIADLDHDGWPEIVVAGGNHLVALNHDGTFLWTQEAVDESGATGASIFDFESDGDLDVVYIDEQNMSVYEGSTGVVKFFNTEHNSDTMMDYPSIADVDADGQAEIIVAHANFGRALSVYGDQDESWGPARRIWSGHHYFINNIDDDLSIPIEVESNFSTHNTWHCALDTRLLEGTQDELSVEIVDTCVIDCEDGVYYLIARLVNASTRELPVGIPVSLYIWHGTAPALQEVYYTEDTVPSGVTGEPFVFEIPVAALAGADGVKVVADDDGSGLGIIFECDETDNTDVLPGPFCE